MREHANDKEVRRQQWEIYHRSILRLLEKTRAIIMQFRSLVSNFSEARIRVIKISYFDLFSLS